MKKLLSILFCLIMVHPIFAADTNTDVNLDKLKIKIDFNFQKQDAEGKVIEKYRTNDKVDMACDNKWVAIKDHKISKTSHIYLMGKIEKFDDNADLTVDFLIIDIDEKGESRVIGKPKMVMGADEKGEIAINHENEKIRISFSSNT